MGQEVDCFIGIKEVCRIAGFSKSSILRRIKAGRFPAPVLVEGNVTRWDLAEVRAWRAAQFAEREKRSAEEAAQAESRQ